MAATPYQTIYDAFLAKVQEDDWTWSDDMSLVESDWKAILDGAIPYIKFPRIAFDQDSEGFVNQLGNQEIQLLATYMKVEWLDRTIHTWENVKAQYAESDFSQANYLDKLTNLFEMTTNKAEKLQHNYYRAPNGRPYSYSNLAGSDG
ncbi:MAG: hypothetical protein PHQ86_07645 [Dehalococcoidales bacterium]|nr:hypothetical protein [Dehalococcoidales bacterium]